MKKIIFIAFTATMMGLCSIGKGMIKIPNDGVAHVSTASNSYQQNQNAAEQIKTLTSSALNDYQEFLKYIRKVYAGSNAGFEVSFSTDLEFRRALTKEFFNQVDESYNTADENQKKSLANVCWVIYFALRCGDTHFADANYKARCEQLSRESGNSERAHLVYMYKVLEQIPSEESFIFSNFNAFLRDVYHIEVTRK